jgi:hypothetical protein
MSKQISGVKSVHLLSSSYRDKQVILMSDDVEDQTNQFCPFADNECMTTKCPSFVINYLEQLVRSAGTNKVDVYVEQSSFSYTRNSIAEHFKDQPTGVVIFPNLRFHFIQTEFKCETQCVALQKLYYELKSQLNQLKALINEYNQITTSVSKRRRDQTVQSPGYTSEQIAFDKKIRDEIRKVFKTGHVSNIEKFSKVPDKTEYLKNNIELFLTRLSKLIDDSTVRNIAIYLKKFISNVIQKDIEEYNNARDKYIESLASIGTFLNRIETKKNWVDIKDLLVFFDSLKGFYYFVSVLYTPLVFISLVLQMFTMPKDNIEQKNIVFIGNDLTIEYLIQFAREYLQFKNELISQPTDDKHQLCLALTRDFGSSEASPIIKTLDQKDVITSLIDAGKAIFGQTTPVAESELKFFETRPIVSEFQTKCAKVFAKDAKNVSGKSALLTPEDAKSSLVCVPDKSGRAMYYRDTKGDGILKFVGYKTQIQKCADEYNSIYQQGLSTPKCHLEAVGSVNPDHHKILLYLTNIELGLTNKFAGHIYDFIEDLLLYTKATFENVTKIMEGAFTIIRGDNGYFYEKYKGNAYQTGTNKLIKMTVFPFTLKSAMSSHPSYNTETGKSDGEQHRLGVGTLVHCIEDESGNRCENEVFDLLVGKSVKEQPYNHTNNNDTWFQFELTRTSTWKLWAKHGGIDFLLYKSKQLVAQKNEMVAKTKEVLFGTQVALEEPKINVGAFGASVHTDKKPLYLDLCSKTQGKMKACIIRKK